MKITKTTSELYEFTNMVNFALKTSEAETKFGKRLVKQHKIVADCLKEHQEAMEDLRLDLCLEDTDPKSKTYKAPIKEETIGADGKKTTNYVFSKEALKELTKAHREMMKKEIEFEFVISKEQIDCVDTGVQKYFTDFAYPENE